MTAWIEHLSWSHASALLIVVVFALVWLVRKSHQLILPRDVLPPPDSQTERPVFRERR
jgi:hypothetical protein